MMKHIDAHKETTGKGWCSFKHIIPTNPPLPYFFRIVLSLNVFRGFCLTTQVNCTTSTNLLWETAAANKTGFCTHCKPMQNDPPSLLKCEKKKWNETLRSSSVSRCVLMMPTNHAEVWLLPSRDVFLFHLLNTNPAYTAHLSNHSPPHILYRETSIVSSCSCLLSFLSDWKALCEVGWLSESADLAVITIPCSCFTSVWLSLQCISSQCVFPLFAVYSHTVICIHGIMKK